MCRWDPRHPGAVPAGGRGDHWIGTGGGHVAGMVTDGPRARRHLGGSTGKYFFNTCPDSVKLALRLHGSSENHGKNYLDLLRLGACLSHRVSHGSAVSHRVLNVTCWGHRGSNRGIRWPFTCGASRGTEEAAREEGPPRFPQPLCTGQGGRSWPGSPGEERWARVDDHG